MLSWDELTIAIHVRASALSTFGKVRILSGGIWSVAKEQWLYPYPYETRGAQELQTELLFSCMIVWRSVPRLIWLYKMEKSCKTCMWSLTYCTDLWRFVVTYSIIFPCRWVILVLHLHLGLPNVRKLIWPIWFIIDHEWVFQRSPDIPRLISFLIPVLFHDFHLSFPFLKLNLHTWAATAPRNVNGSVSNGFGTAVEDIWLGGNTVVSPDFLRSVTVFLFSGLQWAHLCHVT